MYKSPFVIACFLVFASCNRSNVGVYGMDKEAGGNKGLFSHEDIQKGTFSDSVPMVEVQSGTYTPFFGKADSLVKVEGFFIDAFPVTNQKYLHFVKLNPEWRRSRVKRVMADANYLVGWESDTTLGANVNPDAPVTNISWFAAKAYADCTGKQMPTVAQWEYVATADKQSKDARKKESFNRFILSWYETPNTYNRSVGQSMKNYWGAWDMHGLVWEWTYDFNEIMLSGESRRDVSNDENKFCGSGSFGANDLMNYAAFMRFAFRGSLKANYCLQNQGFRCVKNSQEQ